MPDPFAPFPEQPSQTIASLRSTPGKEWSRWPMTLVALLLFATTTVAAVMATSANRTAIPAAVEAKRAQHFYQGAGRRRVSRTAFLGLRC